MNSLVADVGNSRVKWGWFTASGLARSVALPLNDASAWHEALASWSLPVGSCWTIAGTQPTRRDALAEWLRQSGHHVRILNDYRQLPIAVHVDFPERVGIDRLLNALAVRRRAPLGAPAIVIDAGSAVTVDLVSAAGSFEGGAILPGYRLMAQALKDHTAQLPLVAEFGAPSLPGKNTVEAIGAGIHHTLCGGIDRIVKRLRDGDPSTPVFLAGGDADWLQDLECEPTRVGSALTLEGIWIAAGENQPAPAIDFARD